MHAQLGLHDKASLLPVKLAQVLFRRSSTINARSVDFRVTMRLEDVQDFTNLPWTLNATSTRLTLERERHTSARS